MTLDLKYVIENLDNIVAFFTPASVFIFSYGLFANYSKKIAIFSPETVICSFLINMIANSIRPGISFAMLHLVCLFAGGIVGYLKNLPSVEAWIRRNLNKVYNDDLWYGIADFQLGCYIEVFLKNTTKSYYGVFKDDYMHNGSMWITLSAFTEYDNGMKNEKKSFADDQTRHIAINTDDIARVEIRYSKDSIKIL